MAKPIKITDADVKNARAAGFKRKKPKKPKSKTEKSLNSYIERYNGWAKDLKSKAAEGRKKIAAELAEKKRKQAEKKKLQDLRGTVSKL